MAVSSDPLEVFISWSKQPTADVAAGLSSLLNTMFDNVNPWYSAGNIEPGTRGIPEIQTRLAFTSFGVLIITSHNQGSPWINFEAGALAKTITDDTKTRVVPLLVDLNVADLVPGPLTSLQAVAADEDGVRELVDSIAGLVGVASGAVDARWKSAWPDFERCLDEARSQLSAEAPEPKRTDRELLEELLELQRQSSRALDLAMSQGQLLEPSPALPWAALNASRHPGIMAGAGARTKAEVWALSRLQASLFAARIHVRDVMIQGRDRVVILLFRDLRPEQAPAMASALNELLTETGGSVQVGGRTSIVLIRAEEGPIDEERLAPITDGSEPLSP